MMGKEIQEQREDPEVLQHSLSGKKLEQDPRKMLQLIQRINEEQNLLGAILAGIVAALLGAIIWAFLTVRMEARFGFMAIGIGLLVGNAVRWAGKGVEKKFGVIGAVLAALGCVAGNLFTLVAIVTEMVAQEEGISVIQSLLVLVLSPRLIIDVMVETFSPIDVLFYGLAVYWAYKYAFRKITEDERESLLSEVKG